jgi:4-amino-4-deoxy-L-arabinose transferase-like glycosyltransferase
MTKKNKIFLLIIVAVAFFLRIFRVGNYPPLLWDEAAIGYNAFSIIQTGKDEYGKLLPIIFKSFGDYKPGLYIYLAIPFIKFLGLTTTATRLPSVLLGSLLPLLIYFLIKEINSKAHKTAIIAAIITTINPYSIHFSRGAWETNILTFELVLASYLFFKYLNKRLTKYLFLSSIIFGLTLFTYQAGKMISLFIIIILFLINFKQINLKKYFLSFIFPLILFSIPIIYGLFFNSNGNRLKVVSLFSYPRSNEEIQTIINETNQTDYTLFYSQPTFFLRSFLSRYFNHFSSKFLSFEGDWQNPRHSTPYIGVLLYPSLIFLFVGIFFAFTRSKKEAINRFFLFWLLISPIPSALTRDSIQSVRAMSLSVPLIYFISLGIFAFFQKFNSKILKILIIISYCISFVYYGDLYLNHMVKKNPIDFLYGHQQAIDYLIKNKDRFQQIYMTDYYGQPYIYYLFYSQYSPLRYQQQANLEENSLDTGKVKTIDNIRFETAQFNFIKDHPGTMGIFSQEEIYRQGINQSEDFKNFIPLSPIGDISTFYAYENP